tara:strand:+ start:1633 stop:1908 length:276 start_codon:yes stop_codon:yes gene_type:complete
MSYTLKNNTASTSALENVVEVDGVKFGVYWSATADAVSEFDSEFGPMGTEFSNIKVSIESAWSLKNETKPTLEKIEAELEKLAKEVEFELD